MHERPPAMRLLPLSAFPLAAAAIIAACAGGHMKKPEQGIYGTFTTYGPPRDIADCTPFKTQMEKDDCRRMNERVIEEPHQTVIKVRNLQTMEITQTPLDARGSYKLLLQPGEYEVCVEGECSDPMTVKMNGFVTYGQRLPRPAEAAKPGQAPADSLKRKTEAALP